MHLFQTIKQVYIIMRKNYKKSINTTIYNIIMSYFIASSVAVLVVYIIYFDLRFKVEYSSISSIITKASMFYQVIVPSSVILSSFLIIMYELLYYAVKNNKSKIDKALIYIASIMCITQILIMAITLDESHVYHQLYASIFFMSVYAYAFASLMDNWKYIDIGPSEQSLFSDKDNKLVIFIFLLIGFGIFIINKFTSVFVNTIFSGFSFTIFELYVVTLALLFVGSNIFIVESFKTINLEYLME